MDFEGFRLYQCCLWSFRAEDVVRRMVEVDPCEGSVVQEQREYWCRPSSIQPWRVAAAPLAPALEADAHVLAV